MKNKSSSNLKQDTLLFSNSDSATQLEIPIVFSVMMCEKTAKLTTLAVVEIGSEQLCEGQGRDLITRNKKFFWLGTL